MAENMQFLSQPMAIPTGPRGVGVRAIEYANQKFVMTMTDDTVLSVDMPIGGGMGDGGGDPATSIPLTQEVVDYVRLQLAPRDSRLAGHDSADAALTGRIDGLEATGQATSSRLDSVSQAVDGVIATHATDAEVAAAIANLSIADYLRKADAATLYATKAHNHPISDVANLQTELDKISAAIQGATGVDMSAYATDDDIAEATTPLLGKVEAANTYQPKLPAGQTSGHVLTWDGSKYTPLAAPAGDLTKAQADGYYAAKSHTHSDLQPKLSAGTANGQVLTWNGSAWVAQTSASTSQTFIDRFSMAGTLSVKNGGGRAYNLTGAARTITQLHAAVGTAPAGSAVTAAIKVNGTQVGTVSIAAGALTGTATLTASWPVDGWVTCDVTAVGSTTAGSDLVVTVKAS